MKRLLCLVCLFAWAVIGFAQVAPSILTGPAPQVGDDPLHAQAFAAMGANVDLFLADHAVSYHKTKQGASIGQIVGVFHSYLMSPSGDTTGAKDLAAINAIETAAGRGATVYWRNGVYYFDGNIAITAQVQSWIGQASAATMGPSASGGSTNFPISPYLSGVVLTEIEAATPCISDTATSPELNLANIGIKFGASIANTSTGDGIDVIPTAMNSTGHESGLFFSTWSNVNIYGVDGNHWGFNLYNTLYDTLIEVNEWGGGWGNFVCDSDPSTGTNYGNLWFYGCDGFLSNAGTADTVDLSSRSSSQATPGCLNYICGNGGAMQIEGAAEWNGQKAWNDLAGAGVPSSIDLYNVDTEPCNILTTFTCTASGTAPTAGCVYSTPDTYVPINYTIHSITGSGTWTIVAIGRGIPAASTGTLTYVSGPGSPVSTIAFTAVTSQPEFLWAQGTHIAGIGAQYWARQKNNTFGSASGNNNATGEENVTEGVLAGAALTTGYGNVDIGHDAGVGGLTNYRDVLIGDLSGKNGTGLHDDIYLGYETGQSSQQAAAILIGNYVQYTNTGGTGGTVAIGDHALYSLTSSGGRNSVLGFDVLYSATTAANDDIFGSQGGYNPGGGTNTANATMTGSQITGMGDEAGNADTGDYSYTTWLGFESLVKGNYATALGWKTEAGAAGAVAIGVDHTGTSASTTTQDRIALGTSNHTVYIAGATTHVGAVTQQGAVVETPVGETASFTTGSAAFYNITGAAAGQTVTMTAGPTAGMHVTITNHASQSWTVAPNTGQAINQTTWASGASTVHTGSLTLAAGAKVTLYTPDGVNWDCE